MAGVARAEIARFLGKRYQHVRNVLEGDRLHGRAEDAPAIVNPGVAEQGAPFERGDDPALVQARGAGAYRLVVRPDG